VILNPIFFAFLEESQTLEILFASDNPPATLASMERRGVIRRLAAGIYTRNLADPPEVVIRCNWIMIVGHELPNAVITDRSAPVGGPVNGVLYVSSQGRGRTPIELPGLTISRRPGPGPADGDIPLPGGLFLASTPRGLVDNAAPSRARKGAARTLSATEIGDWVDRICRNDGEDRLLSYRVAAEQIAGSIEATPAQLETVSHLISAAVSSGPQRDIDSPALTARRSGAPYDPDRTKRFDVLIDHLNDLPPGRIEARAAQWQPFFESYFSNFIEGTEFTVEEAIAIAIDRVADQTRPADSHDISGTYALLNDPAMIAECASTPEEFATLLKDRHAMIMGGRPEVRPGQFKERGNQAGSTIFVRPELVVGTLNEGWRRVDDLASPFHRAVYVCFVVAEVHPFDDGNGRLARAFMTSELVATGQGRIIVPTISRNDYLAALRLLSRQDNPEMLPQVLQHLWRFTDRVDFTGLDQAMAHLTASNAFVDATEAEQDGIQLTMPRRSALGL
jgi:Fic/DOC family